MTGVWSHIGAPENGLEEAPEETDRCDFLTVEDFGTQGLEGSPVEWTPKLGKKNSFYAFFRAEAFSEKGGDDRGRWGVGKLVFPRSSKGSAFFGLTVQRSTKRRMLMGRMILRHHRVGEHEYLPDAMFGISHTIEGDQEFVIPTEDDAFVDRFARAFGVTRSREPGLSVVVPWLDEDEHFTVDELACAIAAEYLLPILRSELVVRVSDGSRQHLLDRKEFHGGEPDWIDGGTKELLSLGRFAAAPEASRILSAAPPDQAQAPKWRDPALSEEDAIAAREALESGEAVAFDVPLKVLMKDGPSEKSGLRVHFQRSSYDGQVKPVFVREGITVTSARGPRVSGYATLVTIDDGPLATLLGDSENPAHTEWRPNTKGFKQKYKYGKGSLDFVREVPSQLFSAIFSGPREDDQFALGAFFPADLPSADRGARGGRGKKTRQGGDVPPVPPIERRPKRLAIQQVNGGFEVRSGDPTAVPPEVVRIRAAYDLRGKNPLRRYRTFDFDFKSKEMTVEATGATVTSRSGNEIVASVEDVPFRIIVRGFDENRDVFVDAKPVGESNER